VSFLEDGTNKREKIRTHETKEGKLLDLIKKMKVTIRVDEIFASVQIMKVTIRFGEIFASVQIISLEAQYTHTYDFFFPIFQPFSI
jgi:Ni,Fe-hydrogenase III large subunit